MAVRAEAQGPNFAAIDTLILQSKLDEADRQLQAVLQKQPDNARAETLLGVVRRKQGNWNEAETFFRRAVAGNPKSLEACENLASLLRDEARWPEAVAQYEACRKLAPASTKIVAELAVAYEKNGDYTKSLAIAKKIPEASWPTKLLPAMAADYLATRNSEQAHQAIGRVLQHASADPEIVPELANSLLDHDMPGDASELLRIAQARQKMTPSFQAALARTQAATGHQQEARATITQALKANPKSQEILSAAASLAILSHEWDIAAGFLDAALAAGPPRSDLLQSAVFVEMQNNDMQAANAVAQHWYKLRPDETASALAYSVVLVEGNHWGEAQPLLEKILAKTPNDKRALLAMGVVEYNAGELAAAKQHLSRSIGGGPDDANAHYFLGLVAKREGDFAGAISQMQQSVTLRPNNPKALGALGQLYLQQNQISEARAVLEKAVQVAPDEPQNHYELARVYNKLSMKDEAEEQIKLYQKLRPQRPQSPGGEPPATKDQL